MSTQIFVEFELEFAQLAAGNKESFIWWQKLKSRGTSKSCSYCLLFKLKDSNLNTIFDLFYKYLIFINNIGIFRLKVTTIMRNM